MLQDLLTAGRSHAPASDARAEDSMATTRKRDTRPNKRPGDEAGLPGGGKGRTDRPGRTGVYPLSQMDEASGDAPIREPAAWGQGERGPEGYYDSGSSEVFTIPVDEAPSPDAQARPLA